MWILGLWTGELRQALDKNFGWDFITLPQTPELAPHLLVEVNIGSTNSHNFCKHPLHIMHGRSLHERDRDLISAATHDLEGNVLPPRTFISQDIPQERLLCTRPQV